MEASHDMFTANMQSFILINIYIGSQIMHIYNNWISTTQYIFQQLWYVYMKLYLSLQQCSAVWLSLVNLKFI